jgi:rhodanese-related sulfurtransferase
MNKKLGTTERLAILTMFVFGLSLASFSYAEGNRYNLTRLYKAEISAAKAYIDSHPILFNKHSLQRDRAVIIDVRKIEEFVQGHPPGAINIPFPHITGNPDEPFDRTEFIGYDISTDGDIAQSMANFGVIPMQEFIDYVTARIPDKDQYIITLCRSGFRSVQAANLLAKNGYTNVHNLWEGFQGQHKLNITDDPVDLNNDGAITNDDKDGWEHFQNLPVEDSYRTYQIFWPYSYLY